MSLTKNTFESIKDKSFEIAFNSKKSTICQLIEVKGINSDTIKEGQTEPFSLMFETPGDLIYEQNTYRVNNADLEEFALFLVPVGADENGVRYEAVFT